MGLFFRKLGVVSACLAVGCSDSTSESRPESSADAAVEAAASTVAAVDASVAPDGGSPSGVAFAGNESLQTLSANRTDASGNPVTIAFDLITPPVKPARVVVLLVGDNGVLGLSSTGFSEAANSFLVRTRQAYASAGVAAALVDSPSDHPSGLDNFRGSAQHAADVGVVIAWLSAKWNAPVWVVGTSRGTISAANAAARNTGISAPSGVVLTSAINAIPSDATDQESIGASTTFVSTSLPTLFVHNTLDECEASPLTKAQDLAKKIASATFTTVTGGAEVASGKCDALTYHGFYGPHAPDASMTGLDTTVVPMITTFIAAH